MKNSIIKRIKISRKGKILRRISGQSHFLSKKSSKKIRKKRKLTEVNKNILRIKV